MKHVSEVSVLIITLSPLYWMSLRIKFWEQKSGYIMQWNSENGGALRSDYFAVLNIYWPKYNISRIAILSNMSVTSKR